MKLGDYTLSLEGSVAPDPQLERTQEVGNYITGYYQLGFLAGAQLEINQVLPEWMQRSGPEVLVGYSYLGGDEGNLGSHRHQGELWAGWKQSFFKYLFIDVRVGLGVAANSLNFGKGFPLEQRESLNVILEGRVGLQHCFTPSFCLSLSGGYFYEQTLGAEAGLDNYQNQGWRFGSAVTIRPEMEKTNLLPPPPPPKPSENNGGDKKEIITVERVIEKRVPVPVRPRNKDMPLLDPYRFSHGGWNNILQPNYNGKKEVTGYGDHNLDTVAGSLLVLLDKKYSDVKVKIDGYANRSGGPANASRILSLRRALWVRDYLVKKMAEMARAQRMTVTDEEVREKVFVDGEFLNIEREQGRPVEIDYENIDNEKILDARGRSVHGDGRRYGADDTYEELPINDRPEDSGNQCVMFSFVGNCKKVGENFNCEFEKTP